MNPFAGQIGMNTMQASQAMPTIGNRQAMQQGEQSTLAQLLESYKQALERGQQGQQMRQSDFVQGSGALGALAQMAQTYMGGRVSRKANESAKELADRIMRAQTDAEQSKAQQARMAKIAEEQRLMDARRKAYGNDQEMFALTGDVTKPARGVPFMSDQGLVIVDPVSGEFRPATPQGQQQQAGPPVTIDPSLPPEIQAAIRANPQQWASAPDGAQINVQQPRAPQQGPLRPYEKPVAQVGTLAPEEVAAVGLPAGTVAQRDPSTGKIDIIHSPQTKDAGGGKALNQGTVNSMTKDAGKLENLTSLAGMFSDNYAGGVALGMGGDIENLSGRLGGPSTPGQAEWWQQYDRLKNEVRNELFGASLTTGEAAAFKSADITPNMDPKVVRENLAMQSSIIQRALERKAKTWAAQGYNKAAIQEATGIDLGGGAAQGDDDALINKYLKP